MAVAKLESGLLLIDKPPGLTSHDIVDLVRAIDQVGDAKVGHTGTLDPFATGLLILVVGRARRYQNEITDLGKRYDAVAQFGARSTTGDTDGFIEVSGGQVDEAGIQAQLLKFTGQIRQKVPATSAVKVAGERLYKKAHRGEVVDTPTRTVRVCSIEIESFDHDAQRAFLKLEVGRGTYVRQLISDLAEAAGSAAYCRELRRTAVGEFGVGDAVDSEQLTESVDITNLPAWKPLRVMAGSVQIA